LSRQSPRFHLAIIEAENKRAISPIDLPKRVGSGPITQDRLTARIARDRPDILERMKAGEFKSVRQAALEAGLITPEFSIPIEPQGAARRILNRFSGEPLRELVRILANHAGMVRAGAGCCSYWLGTAYWA
jgi:hypothetical protein